MIQVFELVLRVLSIKEITTKWRRASSRAQFLTLRYLSTIPERTFFANNLGKLANFPPYRHHGSNGKRQKHYIEMFNQIRVRVDPE